MLARSTRPSWPQAPCVPHVSANNQARDDGRTILCGFILPNILSVLLAYTLYRDHLDPVIPYIPLRLPLGFSLASSEMAGPGGMIE